MFTEDYPPSLPTCFGSKKSFYNRTPPQNDMVHKLFNKVYTFRKDSSVWVLPRPERTFAGSEWDIKSLIVLKNSINYSKSQLDNYPIKEWSEHTRRMNIAGDVRWRLKRVIQPEFLTQAWTKFFECVSKFKAVPDSALVRGQLNSLHLCEAPGAFIASLNHYLKISHPNLEWDWLATTLNPYYEGNSPSRMICDDRFLFHTLDKWDFGLDNTGDIMNWENSQSLIQRAKKLGDVQLLSADGSIDCMMTPDKQERVVAPLHYCEIVTALQVLAEGGTFICKFFTIFEHPAVCMLYLLNVLFSEVIVFKPATSKEGNSEVYIVCLRYSGFEALANHLPNLKKGYGNDLFETNAIFPLNDIPESFITKVEDCAKFFVELQRGVIDSNVFFFEKHGGEKEYARLKNTKCAVAQNFLDAYKLRRIAVEEEVLEGVSHEEQAIIMNPRNAQSTSYADRVNFDNLDIEMKIAHVTQNLDRLKPTWPFEGIIQWLSLGDERQYEGLTMTRGRRIESLNSSKFASEDLFKMHRNIQTICSSQSSISSTPDKRNMEDFIALSSYYAQESTTYAKFGAYNAFEDYTAFETRQFDELTTHLKYLKREQSIVLCGFSILSHFSVGVLYVLASQVFERVGLSQNGLVLLQNLMDPSKLCVLDEVMRARILAFECGETILGIVPVKNLRAESFFYPVLEFNNTLLKRQSECYINCIKNDGINAAKD